MQLKSHTLQASKHIQSILLNKILQDDVRVTEKAKCCGYRYLEQLPPTLFVTELLARSAVQMSKHYIVQCRLGFLTDRQLTKLQV